MADAVRRAVAGGRGRQAGPAGAVRRIEGASRPPKGSDPANFVLPATTQRLVGADDRLSVRLYRVEFGEGGRTFWHVHDAPQLLYGLAGRCVVVDRAGEELVLEPGDLVVIETGEEHWHGAAPGGSGAHLAINLGMETRWLESSA